MTDNSNKIKKVKTASIGESENKNPFEGKRVIFVSDENDKINADGMRGHLKAVGDIEYHPRFYDKFVKRVIDIILSLGGLIVLSPIFAIVALAIILEDPGPVLFTQQRIGKNKKYFKLHKFRSMKMSTPHDVPTHMLENPDQYITKVGKFIRAHSLDELPQIRDVFVGNMSLIGPRPALWNQDVLIAERDKYGANDVKPGLTGWAQINGRDELALSVKARLDGEYVQKESFLFDVKCFLGTISKVIRDDTVVEGGLRKVKNNSNNKMPDTEEKKRKKIIVLSSHTPSLFWFRMDMMKYFGELGYEVIAVGNESENDWKGKFSEYGVCYYSIEIKRNGTNPLNDLSTLCSLLSILKKEMPDKIFAYQAKTVIYGSLAAKKIGVEEVYPLIAGIGSIFLAEGFKAKILKTILTTEYRLAIRKCPRVFFQNVDDMKVFRKYHIVNQKQVAMIHGSGVNLGKFQIQQLPEEISFLCISRLIRDKGVYEYLEACRKIKESYPKIRCLLVGPFDSNPSALKEDELDEFIEEGSVEYFGEKEDVRPYLQQASVFVLPSYREGTPKTVLEAMASGRAIITTDAPGCRETVKDGESGFLVPVRDVEAIVLKMKYFIENKQMVKQMGSVGRTIVEDKFDVIKVNKSIADIMKL